MRKDNKKNGKFFDLRNRAEALLSKSEERISDMSIEDIKRLVHELDTHQIELELQNEDLKKAQLLLEKARENYYELFDLAPCGYLKLNHNGIIIEANFSSTELLGITKDNLINRKFTDFISDDYQDEFYRIYTNNNDFSTRKSCELKLKRNKKDFWTHLELKFLKTAENSSYSYLITLNDISQQKNLQFFNDLTKNINDAIFFINPETAKFIDINEQAAKSLGYSRDALLTMNVFDIETVFSNKFSWKKHVEEVYKKGSLLIETLHKRKNGTVFPVEVNITTTNYSNCEYMIEIARDISERKTTEDLLKKSEYKYKTLLDNIPQKIFMKDKNSVYLSCNINYAKDLKLQPEEIEGKTDYDFYDRKLAEKYRNDDIRIIESGKTEIIEEEYILNKERKIVHTVKAPVKDEEGKITGILGIFHDITELKNAEQLVIKSQKMQAVGTLAGGMAHEFNNIIGIIMGYAQILIDSEDLTEKQKEGLNIIYNQGERAASIIDNILKFSHKKDIDLELVDLENLLNNTIKIISLLLPKNITLSRNIEKDLPLIKGNPTQIQQALINISNNSIQAMGKKKAVLKFSLGLEENYSCQKSQNSFLSNNYLKLCIKDEGCGMSDDVINQIFDPFFTTKAPGKGTGLGLSVVHGIMKAHNGEISLKSKQNVGTEICMYFPPVLNGKKISHSVPRKPSHGIERILIVEDEADMLEFLSFSLARQGYRVTKAINGIEALEIFRKTPARFDLVISDYAMPFMTGVELYEKLCSANNKIFFILITGYKDINLEKYLNEKNIVSLYKPIDINELTDVIRIFFDGSGDNEKNINNRG